MERVNDAEMPEDDPAISRDDLRRALVVVQRQRDEYAGQIAQIRGVMGTVTVYQGLVDVSPTVMMVTELARDHDALEGRIDLAIAHIKGLVEGPKFTFSHDDLEGIASLLRGGSPVPDTIEELES